MIQNNNLTLKKAPAVPFPYLHATNTPSTHCMAGESILAL